MSMTTILGAKFCLLPSSMRRLVLSANNQQAQLSCRRFFSAVTNNNNDEDDDDHGNRNDNKKDTTDSIRNASQIPLGAPLPMDEHACSVSLPTWSAVVGYEEGDSAVVQKLKTGYPRFVYHPYTLQLMNCVLKKQHHCRTNNYSNKENKQVVEQEQDCLVLPSAQAAARCQAFLQKALGETTTIDNALIEQETSLLSKTDDENSSSSSSRIRRVCISSSSDDNETKKPAAAEVHAVLFPATTEAGTAAKAYWQHTGEVVSSRRAEYCLRHVFDAPILQPVTSSSCEENNNTPYACHSSFPTSVTANNSDDDDEANKTKSSSPHAQLASRIAEWASSSSSKKQDIAANHVFLAPSGMAAIYTALRSARRYQMQQQQNANNKNNNNGGGTSIVYGFPYLDTLKLCSRPELCPDGVEFFGRGDADDLQALERLLLAQNNTNNTYCALFTEVPSNPLLQCPDLIKLRELADTYNFLLVVDDTIANFLNVNVLESGLADAVCTSLTKIVSGRGDAIAGSVVTNPHTPGGRWMQQDLLLQKQQNDQDNGGGGLYCQDAHAVLCNSVDFVERNARINATAEQLADWLLLEHPDVDRVYYPKHSAPLYPQLMRPTETAGYGGLMSIILHPHMCQRNFYDALDVAKGPSLGTNFTLVCPYTLLAHYHELDFAMSYNVPPNLLRISVGLEPLEDLQRKFDKALSQSRLYPKICMSTVQEKQQQKAATARTPSSSSSSS